MRMKHRIGMFAYIAAIMAGDTTGASGTHRSSSRLTLDEIRHDREEKKMLREHRLENSGLKMYNVVLTDTGVAKILAINKANAYRKAGVITRKEMRYFNHVGFRKRKGIPV